METLIKILTLIIFILIANMCNKLIKAVKRLDKIIKESDNK